MQFAIFPVETPIRAGLRTDVTHLKLNCNTELTTLWGDSRIAPTQNPELIITRFDFLIRSGLRFFHRLSDRLLPQQGTEKLIVEIIGDRG